MVESGWLSTLLRSGLFATSCRAILMVIISCGGGNPYEFGSNGKNEGWKRSLRERGSEEVIHVYPCSDCSILGRLPNSQHSA